MAPERDKWRRRNRHFYEDEKNYFRFLIPPNKRVLEIGAGTGDLLAAMSPSYGLGIDISPMMVEVASSKYNDLDFRCADVEDPNVLGSLSGPFDYIILSDTAGYLDDLQRTFALLREVSTPETRVVIAYFSQLWRPILAAGERVGMKMPDPPGDMNWLSSDDLAALLELADMEVITRDWRMLVPRRLMGLGPALNKSLGTLPLVRRLSLRHYVVARPFPAGAPVPSPPSCSVVVACRNEAGNIEPTVDLMPWEQADLEVIFVEGGSTDGTRDEIERVIRKHQDRDIQLVRQSGTGKGDAVRAGFEASRGDILIVHDGDMTVAPADISKFIDVLSSGKGEFVNGTRLVYPMERGSMLFLNFLANHVFARIFSWLLGQRITDTLCANKGLRRHHYEAIAANRSYFGDFDPFGDFDLLFGAAKLRLRIAEVPVRYRERQYGESKVIPRRFRHGWELLRMVAFAWRKLKAF